MSCLEVFPIVICIQCVSTIFVSTQKYHYNLLLYCVQSDEVVMDLTKLFQCSVMEEFDDIMSDSVKSMSINNTSEWWALRTSLDVRMKVNNYNSMSV